MNRTFEFSCPLPHGLHARPATALASFCEPFESTITLTNTRTGTEASARSVLALISADIRLDEHCLVAIDGDDADAALEALQSWVDEQLPHCDDGLELAEEAGAAGEIPRSLALLQPDFVSGTGLSTGIGVGVPVVLSGPRFPAALLGQVGEGAEQEWRKISAARASVVQQLEADHAARGGTEASILRAHLAILQDEEYSKCLHAAVSQSGSNPSAAKGIAAVVDHFDILLGETGNPYLQERALDIQDVSQKLVRAIYGEAAQAPLPLLDTDSIIVADSLVPGDFIALNGPHLKGMVLESGGRTSHTVLLARAAGIPVLTGASNAAAFARSAKGPVIVDAGSGLLLDATADAVAGYYQREQEKLDAIESGLAVFSQREARTRNGLRIEVAANIALAEEAEAVFANGAEGIGVFRTEMLFVGRDEPPAEEEQYKAYRHVAEAAEGRPVIIRTFDIGGDKPVPWLQGPAEENPFLGVRGARLYPEAEDVFRTQLRAMLRAAAHGDVRIMVPMISTADELRWARGIYDDVRSELEKSGNETASAPFGIMIEVPAAVYSIDKLAPLSDFFSIGSNDLAQYFMAADRGNDRLQSLYSNFQPAFLRLLQETVDEAKTHGQYTGLCGDMASDERALPLLVALGLDEISLTSPQIPRTKAAMAELDSAACRGLMGRVVCCENSAEVLAELEKFQSQNSGQSLFSEDLVVFSEGAETKEAAIKELVDRVHLAGRTDRVAALETAVWQREDVFSTGLGFGIAIPHCKSSAVGQNSLCVARYRKPLDWQSRDGQPVDTVIMLIVRESDAGEAHMKIFAQLARNIMHEEFRDGLRACPDAKSLLQFLKDAVDS